VGVGERKLYWLFVDIVPPKSKNKKRRHMEKKTTEMIYSEPNCEALLKSPRYISSKFRVFFDFGGNE